MALQPNSERGNGTIAAANAVTCRRWLLCICMVGMFTSMDSFAAVNVPLPHMLSSSRLFMSLAARKSISGASFAVPRSLQVPCTSTLTRPAHRGFSLSPSASASPPPPTPPGPGQTADMSFGSSYMGKDGTPRAFCNWVIPGKIMIGRYPHRYPAWSKSGSPSEDEAREHLTKIIEAGVTTFVCLQDEVPAQDDNAAWPSSGPLPPRDIFVPEKLVTRPGADLIEPRGFWRYRSDACAIARTLGSQEPSFVHFPIRDGGVAEERRLADFLMALKARLDADGGVMYVHCWAGRGRAGTVGACLALLMGHVRSSDEALSLVQAGYDTRAREEGGAAFSPETEEQRAFVRAFAAEMTAGQNVRIDNHRLK